MSWYAKRTGGYETDSSEYESNVWEIYNTLSNDTYLSGDRWSYESIVGLIANATTESHLNPWVYNGTTAYGLVQFHPPSYYIGGVGVRYSSYAPSLGATSTDDGARPEDGKAQLQVIDSPSDSKYSASDIRMDKARELNWAILEYTSIQLYKVCDDIDQAIQAFLLFYEYPSDDVSELQTEFNNRRSHVDRIVEILGGSPPDPPDPPVPPVPPIFRKYMPLYFYMGKRFKRKKGLII